MFDIYTIIFLALAVFIFLRLRSVLGQRTGRERPPFDPFAKRNAANDHAPATENKVVALPQRAPDTVVADAARPAADRWAGVAAQGSPVAAGLDAIAVQDKSFDAAHFIGGAKAAYEMIVTAYAEGDRKTLKTLLARDVYDGFESVITERETRGETTESRFVAVDKAEIIGAELRGSVAQITLRFVSQLVSATRDKSGAIVSGNADKVTDVTDVWTFARDVSSRDPNWKLVATEAGH